MPARLSVYASAAAGAETVLEAERLCVLFPYGDNEHPVVDGVSLELSRGRTLALVGESGCGKTMTALSLMGLVEPPGRIASGSVRLRGQELVGAPPHLLAKLRGDRLAIIFQEPMSALNPVMRIGDQVAEPLVAHRGLSWAEARRRAVRLLEQVGIAAAADRARAYPHELSGGMRQRTVIAMALACEPEVIIADEPTTALDVTIQAQILGLLRRLQRERQMAMLFITHDLALVKPVADEVAVMYAGRIVEQGPAARLVGAPRHPYTRALWAASPAATAQRSAPDPARRPLDEPGARLKAIAGCLPEPWSLPSGCVFYPRCDRGVEACARERPALIDGVACTRPLAPGAEHD